MYSPILVLENEDVGKIVKIFGITIYRKVYLPSTKHKESSE